MSERNNPCDQDPDCEYLGSESDDQGVLYYVYLCGTAVKRYPANPPPPPQ